jgi:hypothetical protein
VSCKVPNEKWARVGGEEGEADPLWGGLGERTGRKESKKPARFIRTSRLNKGY